MTSRPTLIRAILEIAQGATSTVMPIKPDELPRFLKEPYDVFLLRGT